MIELLPKCEVCGARGCKIQHAKHEYELAHMGVSKYPEKKRFRDKKDFDSQYEGYDKHD